MKRIWLIIQCLLLLMATTAFVTTYWNTPSNILEQATSITTTTTTNNTRTGSSSIIIQNDAIEDDEDKSSNYNLLSKLGWMESVQYYQHGIVNAALQLKHDYINKYKRNQRNERKSKQQYKNNSNYDKTDDSFVDITPFVTIVEEAIHTLGVRGVWFHVFSSNRIDEELFYIAGLTNEPKLCRVECQYYESWWLYHYVGAITAYTYMTSTLSNLDHTDRQRNRSILWDSSTNPPIYIFDMSTLLHKIHIQQNTTLIVGDMPFHAQHALIWYYVSETLDANTKEFPVQLAQAFCGDFQYDNHKIASVGKRIGYECYHGFGHAIFYFVAKKQLLREQQQQQHIGERDNTTTRTIATFPTHHNNMPYIQFRPYGGFTLTKESYCLAYKLCQNATGADFKEPGEISCHGGFIHSVRLMTNNPRYYKKSTATQMVYEQFQKCQQ